MAHDDIPATTIDLPEVALAHLGRATVYEAQAKYALTCSLKALIQADYDGWIKLDKLNFDQVVSRLDAAIADYPDLSHYFVLIKKNHKRWREDRNFVVHAMWGTDGRGRAVAHCIRRNKTGDENDVVNALNNCFWLSKECKNFQYQVALRIADGTIKVSDRKSPIRMKVPSGLVNF